MTVTDETPLSIDEARRRAKCSRSTIERAIRRYRETSGTEGLPSRRITHRDRGDRRGPASGPTATVVINPSDLERWMDGRPPLGGPPIVPAAAAA